MFSVDEATRTLDAALKPLARTVVPLSMALGRVLAESVVADRDFPPTDRSAMDGFAVRSADLRLPSTLKVVAELPAGGDPAGIVVSAGEACRIFTGAVIPSGADAVVMVECTTEDRGAGTVDVDDTPEPGRHIRRHAQDLRRGARVLDAGTPIRSAEIAALASVGCVRVPVFEQPRVAVLSTGDEVVPPEATPAAHQIRNSNAAMLESQVREAGFEATVVEHAGDDAEDLRRKLGQGLDYDLLLVTGGVSVGDYDLVARELSAAGVETLFHGVKMKPGKPILAARSKAGFVLGLPGNPLSAFVGFKLFGQPALRRLAGLEDCWPRFIPVTLEGVIRCKPGRQTYHLARIEQRPEGPVAVPVSNTGSGDVLSLARANALVVTYAAEPTVRTGAILRALSF